MIRIKTRLNGGYSLFAGRGISDKTAELIEKENINDVKRIMIVSDTNVYPLYGEKLKEVLRADGYKVFDFVFPAGEHSKKVATVEALWDKLGDCAFTRNDLLIALGGGVTGDITGFAAATYLMGIRFIQMPTSLLSMTDTAIGGRNVITLNKSRTLAGARWHPSLIICDTAFLDTLLKETFNEGMSEPIKFAMTGSDELFNLIMQDKPDIEKIIALSAYEKKEKFESENDDEIETLWFGYTAADAVEALSDYTISRGKAIATGMLIVTKTAAERTIGDPNAVRMLVNMLKKYDLPTETELTHLDVAKFTINEKRRDGDIITLVIPVSPGKCIIKKLNISHYENFFKKG